MTLLDRAEARPRVVRLRRLETGVPRLASAAEAPVILLPDLAPEVLAAVAPLLARRREVLVVDDADADVDCVALACAIAQAVGADRVALVGGAFASTLAAALGSAPLGASAEATVVLAPLPGAAALQIVTEPSVSAGGDAAATAVSGHPVETAHLIDSYLRDPRRYPAGSRLERARP